MTIIGMLISLSIGGINIFTRAYSLYSFSVVNVLYWLVNIIVVMPFGMTFYAVIYDSLNNNYFYKDNGNDNTTNIDGMFIKS